ncbi:sigma 54-interacting transcriptional regulator [Anoxynatronum buryatiense]|uniref:Arginine utilization regulatory protein n=1 Tax=Anoxynatronum buryatiense TaxID=489973 RepID=A0AA46AHM5_9CLOT|nr:sigma 54-interacting transcriptional regulator [Anoxynatronum buryatiense]SMP41085.1 arginine utilization regulatory protein [Anoxynatronum buryatiense]
MKKPDLLSLPLTLHDLTQHDFYRQILDRCNDGVNVADLQGRLVYANPVSAAYAGSTPNEMIGEDITRFYPKAVLLSVLETQRPVLDKQIHFIGGKKYLVSSFPIYLNGRFCGAYSVFKDIQDIEILNRRIKALEMKLSLSSVEHDPMQIIGNEGSLKEVLRASQRTVGSLGGPRHSIIIGESGTGKTMLARMIYHYAIQVGVLDRQAPFVEINCAQYTNADIAAVEIFGSEEGAYTGSKQKKGLFEQASGGILFLDEAHALEHYQTTLLKAVESGKIRRIGGNREIAVDVIVIAASTHNLKDELLPELYQRLAQYELVLPTLGDRSTSEKEALLHHFIKKYEDAVAQYHGIQYQVRLSPAAREALLKAQYPRNIRQLRDVVNHSIDAASPLISEVQGEVSLTIEVQLKHLPFDCQSESTAVTYTAIEGPVKQMVHQLAGEGLGPRKIARALQQEGWPIEYYQVAYYLKRHLS